jgi:precorrin-4 methylase
MSTWSRLLGDVMVRAWVKLVGPSPLEEGYMEDVPAAVAARATIEAKKRIVIEVSSIRADISQRNR